MATKTQRKDDKAHEPPHGTVRLPPADYLDEHRSWTAQSGDPFPGASDLAHRVHPSELPDPDVVRASGHVPHVYPHGHVDESAVTLPPSTTVPLDHSEREVHRVKAEENKAETLIEAAHAAAKKQVATSTKEHAAKEQVGTKTTASTSSSTRSSSGGDTPSQ